MGVEVVAAGSRVWSVVVVRGGDAWRPEAVIGLAALASPAGACARCRDCMVTSTGLNIYIVYSHCIMSLIFNYQFFKHFIYVFLFRHESA